MAAIGPTTVILETSFLIDLERERLAGDEGPAHTALERHAQRRLVVTETIAGELAVGIPPGSRSAWEALLAPFAVIPIDRSVAWHYGQVHRFLSANGMLIGANDMWIAATARAHDIAVLTRDVAHFRRVPDLGVIAYRE